MFFPVGSAKESNATTEHKIGEKVTTTREVSYEKSDLIEQAAQPKINRHLGTYALALILQIFGIFVLVTGVAYFDVSRGKELIGVHNAVVIFIASIGLLLVGVAHLLICARRLMAAKGI